MKITIRSYDIVTALLPRDMRLDRIMGKPLVVELQEGARVLDIFEKLPWLGRPLEDTILAFVNGESGMLNDELKSGDVIDLLGPSGGG